MSSSLPDTMARDRHGGPVILPADPPVMRVFHHGGR
jgi:hypothetical protein